MFCFSLLSAAGCTFDEDSDPSLCEFSQGEEDDFDWQLFRNHASPHSTSDLLRVSHRGPVHLGWPPTGLISDSRKDGPHRSML
ncbi:receptor-type tyrosine-protein phosphatase U-like, partial [Sinocyclocheilus anshuiensis]|uniref:receptor-type tyrosine-protein phosphatase U-like n=1 Tax=Sinocyclocheilus anshuiensis TaxID=1608454 RepID=UPI0007BA2446